MKYVGLDHHPQIDDSTAAHREERRGAEVDLTNGWSRRHQMGTAGGDRCRTLTRLAPRPPDEDQLQPVARPELEAGRREPHR